MFTARGGRGNPTLDMADVAWGVRCGVGARRDGSSSPIYFVLDACGCQVTVDRLGRGYWRYGHCQAVQPVAVTK